MNQNNLMLQYNPKHDHTDGCDCDVCPTTTSSQAPFPQKAQVRAEAPGAVTLRLGCLVTSRAPNKTHPAYSSRARGVRFTGPTASNTGVEALVSSAVDGNGDGNGTRIFKYMLGTFHFAAWTGPKWPNASSTSFAANNSQWAVTADCSAGCLYDLTR